MLKYLYLVAATFVLAVMSTSGAVAGPQDRSVMPEGTVQLAADWDDRVCCSRNGNEFWTTYRRCERAGGDRVRNGRCRDEWNNNWDSRWRNWDGDWNRRVCCARSRHNDWWSTPRDCRERGGFIVRDERCRNGERQEEWNDNWDSRWRNWGGDWNERICCKRGRHDWWSSRRECRDAGGWQTERRECRDD